MISLRQFGLGMFYYFQAVRILWRLKNYLKHHFITDLDFPTTLQKDYYYQSGYYNRTKQYMHANHFFGELLCVLRGYKMNDAERKRFANLSACAPIFDDFFDKENPPLEKIKHLLNKPESEIPTNEQQKLAVHFLQTILDDLDEKDAFLLAANELFFAQEQAKKMQAFALNAPDLWLYSKQKGGFSGLMYALLLSHSQNEDEKEIAFLLGAFGQFMDDVFDLYDDSKVNTYTLPNTATSVKEIADFFELLLDELIQKAKNLKRPKNIENDFINILQVFASAVRLALSQYAANEKMFQTRPNESCQIDRKYWIVDMEKPTNAFKMFKIGLNYLR